MCDVVLVAIVTLYRDNRPPEPAEGNESTEAEEPIHQLVVLLVSLQLPPQPLSSLVPHFQELSLIHI